VLAGALLLGFSSYLAPYAKRPAGDGTGQDSDDPAVVAGPCGRGAVGETVRSWHGRLVTTNEVIAETVTVTLYRFGHAAALTIGETLWGGAVSDGERGRE